MKQTTIYLPDELKERLERAAAEARCSEAALVREALVEALARREVRADNPVVHRGGGTIPTSPRTSTSTWPKPASAHDRRYQCAAGGIRVGPADD